VMDSHKLKLSLEHLDALEEDGLFLGSKQGSHAHPVQFVPRSLSTCPSYIRELKVQAFAAKLRRVFERHQFSPENTLQSLPWSPSVDKYQVSLGKVETCRVLYDCMIYSSLFGDKEGFSELLNELLMNVWR
jgi:hypothetical protein